MQRISIGKVSSISDPDRSRHLSDTAYVSSKRTRPGSQTIIKEEHRKRALNYTLPNKDYSVLTYLKSQQSTRHPIEFLQKYDFGLYIFCYDPAKLNPCSNSLEKTDLVFEAADIEPDPFHKTPRRRDICKNSPQQPGLPNRTISFFFLLRFR